MPSKFLICAFLVVLLKNSLVEGVTCTYQIDSRDNSYGCILDGQVIRSDTDLSVITGSHLSGYSDESVSKLLGGNSTIEVFPSAIVNKFTRLRQIWITNNKIKSFPAPIENCAYLESINLSFNEISSLPQEIFTNCNNLVEIMMIGNGIEAIHVDAFKGLGKLDYLDLQMNNITSLNAGMFEPTPNIIKLNLFDNKISTFPKEIFESLTILAILNLGLNEFTRWTTSLPTMHSSVRVLNLSRNKIKTVEAQDFSSLYLLDELWIGGLLENIPQIEGLNNLTKLNLDYNQIKTVSLESFRVYGRLQQLYLSNNLIESVNFTKASANLLSNLQVLFLSSNKIETLPVDSFTALTLTTLNLQGNSLKKLEAIDIKPNDRLSLFDVSNNKIEKIQRELFQNITRSITFRAKENVCVNDDFTIGRDFQEKVAPLLEKCFNFGVVTHANIVVLIAATLLSVLVK